jgi:EAL domain-containing protein (putative c-di-GMP-specific phosphodiesterase class I)/ActR/RegA family two-component response regulator
MEHRLLILDDDAALARFMCRVGEDVGYAVRTAESVGDFRAVLRAWQPDSILLDLRLGQSDGIEVLRSLALQGCRARVILTSGVDDRTLAAARDFAASLGLNIGAAIRKPMRAADLRAALSLPAPTPAEPTATELADGLANAELVLEYQPIVSCTTRGLVGLEALARWHRPGYGRIPPDRFIPLAEADTELTDKLTFAVATRAAQDWPTLTAAGLTGTLCLNISAGNLRRLDFPERLAAVLVERGVPPTRVTLEITETVAMADPVLTMDILLRLRLKGFSLSIDDFGTGYSSLGMLRQLPYGEVKIDRSFVKGMSTSRDHLAVVRAVLALANAMEIKTVAEGVEDEPSLAMLTELGCSCAQGFGICRPLEPSKLAAWVTSHVGCGTDRGIR